MTFADRRRQIEARAARASHELNRSGFAIPTDRLARAELDLVDAEEAEQFVNWGELLSALTARSGRGRSDPVAAAVVALLEDRLRYHAAEVKRARDNRDRLAAAVDSMTPRVPRSTRLEPPDVPLAPGAHVPNAAEVARLLG